MKQNFIIPIIIDDYNNENILYLYTNMLTRLNSVDAVLQASSDSVIFYDWKEETAETKKTLKHLLNVDPKTYSKVRFLKVDEVRTDDFVVLMPFEIWEEFIKVSRELKTGRRKTVARVFIYFYYWCTRFGIWGRSRERLVKDLNIDRNHLAESIAWLEEKGFLIRSDFHWYGDTIYSRSYIIPDIMKAEKSSCENGKTQI